MADILKAIDLRSSHSTERQSTGKKGIHLQERQPKCKKDSLHTRKTVHRQERHPQARKTDHRQERHSIRKKKSVYTQKRQSTCSMAVPTGPTFMSQPPILIAEKDAISVPCLIFVIVLFGFFFLFPLLLVLKNCTFSIICFIIFLKFLVFIPFIPSTLLLVSRLCSLLGVQSSFFIPIFKNFFLSSFLLPFFLLPDP